MLPYAIDPTSSGSDPPRLQTEIIQRKSIRDYISGKLFYCAIGFGVGGLGYDQAVELYCPLRPPSLLLPCASSRHYIVGATTAVQYCSTYTMQRDPQEVVSIQPKERDHVKLTAPLIT